MAFSSRVVAWAGGEAMERLWAHESRGAERGSVWKALLEGMNVAAVPVEEMKSLIPQMLREPPCISAKAV